MPLAFASGMPVSDKVYTLKDVSSHDLVVALAKSLKQGDKLHPPKWMEVAKTGPFKELAPYDQDFYFIRAGEPSDRGALARAGASIAYGECPASGCGRIPGLRRRRGQRGKSVKCVCLGRTGGA